jgi:bifunctional DNA-binding transcriptional regulator/antitoxin component of YhaV-PrlF toxin-antitoxin module
VDRVEAMRIAASDATVADKIRALDAAGYPRAEIAKLLDRRYQHVRNVLEGDKLRRRRAPDVPPGGVAEPGRRFEPPAPTDIEDRGGGAYRLVVREDGSVALPAAVRAAFGIEGRGVVMARLEGDEFRIVSAKTALRRVQEMLRPYGQEGVSWADELIAERRRETARDDANG